MSSPENDTLGPTSFPIVQPLDQDVPPGYTLRIFNNEKYMIPNFAVAGLEAKLASRDERDRFGVESVPFTVSF